MTEAEYIDTTALAQVRAAKVIVREIFLESGADEQDQNTALPCEQ